MWYSLSSIASFQLNHLSLFESRYWCSYSLVPLWNLTSMLLIWTLLCQWPRELNSDPNSHTLIRTVLCTSIINNINFALVPALRNVPYENCTVYLHNIIINDMNCAPVSALRSVPYLSALSKQLIHDGPNDGLLQHFHLSISSRFNLLQISITQFSELQGLSIWRKFSFLKSLHWKKVRESGFLYKLLVPINCLDWKVYQLTAPDCIPSRSRVLSWVVI